MRVHVISDMEGVAGITNSSQTNAGEPLYEEGRKLYTAEINAAVRGARAAGATEVVVMDHHGAGGGYSFNSLLPELLDPGCEFVVQEEWTQYTGFLEQGVDFVTYFSAGTSFYVRAKGGPSIMGLPDLCGHTVAVEKGTIQADDATAQSKKCTSAGKAAVKVSVFPDQNGANLALSSGRAQVGMADSPVAAWIVKESSGKFKLTGQPYDTAPYGIAVPKDSGLAKPIQAALEQVIADGTYATILEKWGIQQGGISSPQINAAKS